MVKATLRTAQTDAIVQRTATTAAKPAAVPARPTVASPARPAIARPAVQVSNPLARPAQVAVAPTPRAVAPAPASAARVLVTPPPVAAAPAPVGQPGQKLVQAPAPQRVVVPPARNPGGPLAAAAAAKPAASSLSATIAAAPTPAPKTRSIRKRKETPAPVQEPAAIEVETTVVPTETPVEEVQVESVNTVATTVGPEDLGQMQAQAEFDQGWSDAVEGKQPMENPTQPYCDGYNQAVAQMPAEEQVATYPEQAPIDQTPSDPAQALIPRPPSAVGRSTATYGDGVSLLGDWSGEDLKFPQLKLVQGSGPLSTLFNDGTVIYSEQELLPPLSVNPEVKNPVLRIIPVQLIKQFREKLTEEEQQAGGIPRIAMSREEVESNGGTTIWGGGNEAPPNFWGSSAKCLLLIEQPEGSEHPGFVLELDGKLYAVAVYYAAGKAWSNFAKIIFNTAVTNLVVPLYNPDGTQKVDDRGRVMKRPLLYKNFWSLTWVRKPSGDHNVWQPVTRLLSKEETTPEVRAYCDNLVDGGQDASATVEG